MHTKRSSRLLIFCERFILNVIALSIFNVIILVLRKAFHFSFIQNRELLSFTYIVFIALALALGDLFNYKIVKKAIRIENRVKDVEQIKGAMENRGWKIQSKNDNTIVYKMTFLFGIWEEKLSISLTDSEFHIMGPKKYVNQLVSLADLTHEAYDINNHNK